MTPSTIACERRFAASIPLVGNVLYVGNQNYSSWSLRPWLVLTWGGFDFETRLIRLGGAGYTKRKIPEVLAVSPGGTVPVLHADGEVIADSLAISEWAAERVPLLWPRDPVARAQARSAVCEMHSGFGALRAKAPCNIRRRAEPRTFGDDVQSDVARIDALWTALSSRFGAEGPYLFGATPTIADAFFTPVATRFRTYRIPVSAASQRYADTLLADPAFKRWEEAAVREPFGMPEWDGV
jgi:glutathione S-transferase